MPAARLALTPTGQDRLAGTTSRTLTLLATVTIGIIAAVLVLDRANSWTVY